ncbi:MAG: CsbD family protein [Chloroflexota bacterium]|nr:CsbD family protein [Chloroflexota bacterium]
MTDSWGTRFDQLKARMKDAVANTEGEIDADSVVTRLREAASQAGAEVDTEALKARVKEVVGKAEGKVDAEKLRRWIDDVDRDTLKGWLHDAKAMTTSAASAVETQGERLAEQAPGAVDKWLGMAKEKLGDLTGNEELAREGELEHLKGDIKERFASAADTVAAEVKDAPGGASAKD